MQISIEAFPDNGSDALRALVLRKTERVGKFYDRIVDAEAYLKDNGDPKEGCSAELRVNVPGDTLFCEERAESYEEAIDKASRAMERQVKRFKERLADSPNLR